MSKYTTNTASLKTTTANIRTLDAKSVDAKKISLNGKNVLDYIEDSEFKNYDTRDPQLKNDELDIWNTEISLSDNGHIEVKPHPHRVSGTEVEDGEEELEGGWIIPLIKIEYDDCEGITESQLSNLHNAHKIENNEAFDADGNHIMYWQSNGLTGDSYMFWGCTHITSFTSDLSNLMNGNGMFSGCNNLASFNSDLSNLTKGITMFSGCTNLASFTSDLSNLMNGNGMFSGCNNLASFNSDLSSLTIGRSMLSSCTNLTSFSSNLSSLIDGLCMFQDCLALTAFFSDLSDLTNGNHMFLRCTNLTSFSSNLSSLTGGYYMFEDCKLDAQSVANIVHTLPTCESNRDIDIGIGCDNTEEDQLLFAQECDCDTWQELLDDFSAKNWIVKFELNGRPTTTYNMRRGETLPVYTKLEEVIMPTDEKERKPYYKYTSQDGSKFYNINYFHSTNGSTEGYDVFSSLEEAISTYNVTPKN